MLAVLDRLHTRARRVPALYPFTVVTRLLLGVAFIPPGLTKVLGQRFANPEIVTPDTPIGYWFDAFFQTGGYYTFVGAAQVLAGVLLLIPRTALFGAVLYFPIIVNIWVLTVALHFGGTWIITSLMALGCLYLLCWDYDRLRALLPDRPDTTMARCLAGTARSRWLLRGAYVSFIAGAFSPLLAAREIGVPPSLAFSTGGALVVLAGLLALGGWLTYRRRGRVIQPSATS
ncbi:MAG: DoxX family protein [Bacteroidota bacterium]